MRLVVGTYALGIEGRRGRRRPKMRCKKLRNGVLWNGEGGSF